MNLRGKFIKTAFRNPLELHTIHQEARSSSKSCALLFYFNDISLFVRYDIFLAENDITPYLKASTAYVTPLSFSDAMPLPSDGAVWV